MILEKKKRRVVENGKCKEIYSRVTKVERKIEKVNFLYTSIFNFLENRIKNTSMAKMNSCWRKQNSFSLLTHEIFKRWQKILSFGEGFLFEKKKIVFQKSCLSLFFLFFDERPF